MQSMMPAGSHNATNGKRSRQACERQPPGCATTNPRVGNTRRHGQTILSTHCSRSPLLLQLRKEPKTHQRHHSHTNRRVRRLQEQPPIPHQNHTTPGPIRPSQTPLDCYFACRLVEECFSPQNRCQACPRGFPTGVAPRGLERRRTTHTRRRARRHSTQLRLEWCAQAQSGERGDRGDCDERRGQAECDLRCQDASWISQ